MIVQPRRSVTRFFIPLIDVLILLFAIFLIMPFVSGPTSAEPSADVKAAAEKPLPDDVKLLQEMLREEQLRVERLEKERQTNLKDRLVVRVLEIDRPGGSSLHPDRQEIRSQPDANATSSRRNSVQRATGCRFRVLPDSLSAAERARSRQGDGGQLIVVLTYCTDSIIDSRK